MTADHQNPVAKRVLEDYGSITPYIVVRGAEKFLDFLGNAFNIQERGRVYNEDGLIGHAEVQIGNSVIQMFDSKPNWPATPAFLTLYVEDCDAVYEQAVKAGAVALTALTNNAWGDRAGRICDPFGNIWWIQSHMEDVPDEEIGRRMGEQSYIDDMIYFQASLDQELSRRS